MDRLPIKFCKDCVHFDEGTKECRHQASITVSMVTGEERFYSASTMRTSIVPGDCGKDAQYFQPKLSEAA